MTIAKDAASEKPELAARVQAAGARATVTCDSRPSLRRMLEQGEAERELLVKHGLSDKLLEDLTAAVAEFDASVAETNSGRQATSWPARS